MVNVMDIPEEEYIFPGTRACAGCAMALIYRIALKALGSNTIVTVPASCLTVLHGMQGFCTTKISVYHTPFATTGASASGILASLEDKGLEKDIGVSSTLDYKKYKLSPKIIKEAEQKKQTLLANPATNPEILKDEETDVVTVDMSTDGNCIELAVPLLTLNIILC